MDDKDSKDLSDFGVTNLTYSSDFPTSPKDPDLASPEKPKDSDDNVEEKFKEYNSEGKLLVVWEPYGKMTVEAFNKRVWKNIVMLSFAFMCNYIAYGGLASLQSSLHIQQGMGTICTSIRYVALVTSSLFLPKLMIRGISHKWTMAVSFASFLIWEAANGYGVWATMVPASIINGVFVATLWAAHGSYFTEMSREYAIINNENEDKRISFFFAIYYTFYIGAGIFGSLISTTVLSSSPPENYTEPDADIIAQCGMADCPWNILNNTNLEKPADSIVWTLVGIYMCIGTVALLIAIFIVDHLPRHLVKESGLSIREEIGTLLLTTLLHNRQKKQLLIIPITIYMGLSGSYFGAEFYRSWVTCSLGIWMIGLIAIPFSFFGTLTSFAVGRLSKVIGRVPIFLGALVLSVLLQVFLALWEINPDEEWVYYLISTFWGCCDAIWVTLIGIIYGIYFPGESEAAYSNHMLWWCVGLAVGYGYSNALCTDDKLYILFSLLWVSIACYLWAEYIQHKYNDTGTFEAKTEGADVIEMEVPKYKMSIDHKENAI